MEILIVSKVSKASSYKVLARDACDKHTMGNVYLPEIQGSVIVDRVTVLDNSKVCACLSIVFPTTQVFEVVRTKPENGQRLSFSFRMASVQ